MKKFISLLISLSLIISALNGAKPNKKKKNRKRAPFIEPQILRPPKTFHIAKNGKDNNKGTLEKPFATIGHVVKQLQPGDTLYIHNGRYSAEEGNILDLTNVKGTAKAPITITRWKDDHVTLHGTIKINPEGWQPINKSDALYSNLRDGAKYHLKFWKINSKTKKKDLIPDKKLTKDQDKQIDTYVRENFKDILKNVYKKKINQQVWQIFTGRNITNLKPMTVARFPNAPVWSETMWDRDIGWRWVSDMSRVGLIKDHPTRGSMERLEHKKVSFKGAVMIANTGGCFSYPRFVTYHEAGADQFNYRLRDPDEKFDRPYTMAYCLEGLAALDSPGEWFFHKNESNGGTIFVWMPNSKKPGTGNVIMARNTDNILIAGENTGHVIIDGLNFFAGNINTGYSYDVTVKNCEFLYPACSRRAIGIEDMSRTLYFKRSGNFTFLNNIVRYSDGSIKGDRSENIKIENNLFSHIDYASLGSMTLTVSGPGPQVRYNTLEYSGCSEGIKGQFSSYPENSTGPGSATVEFNCLRKMGLIQWDGAAIQNVRVTLRNNWITSSRRMGIRNDEYNFIPIHLHYRNIVLGCEIALAANYHQAYHNTVIPQGLSQRPAGFQIHPGRAGNRNTLARNNAADSFIGEWPPVPIEDYDSNNWNSLKQASSLRDQLRDPDNLDFRPKHDSALIDKGIIIDKVLWPPDWDSSMPVLKPTRPFNISANYNGQAPDLGAYEFKDNWYWIPGRVEKNASHPVPPNDAVAVKLNADLMWREAMGEIPVEEWINHKRLVSASETTDKSKQKTHGMLLPHGKTTRIAYDIYFGTGLDRVKKATQSDPEYKKRQENNIFSPGPLNPDTQYFWRVDVVTREGNTKTKKISPGDVWNFTSENLNISQRIFPASDDISVWKDSKKKIIDTDYNVLEMGTGRTVLLKIPVKAIRGNSRIVSAFLKLRSAGQPITGDVKIYSVPDTDWCEETIKGKMKSGWPSGMALVHTIRKGIKEHQQVEINVTSILTQDKDLFRKNKDFTFALSMDKEGFGQGFYSTEAQEMRYDGLSVLPELIISYQSPLKQLRIRPVDDASIYIEKSSDNLRTGIKASTRMIQDAWVTEGSSEVNPTGESLYFGRDNNVQKLAMFEFRVKDILPNATIEKADLTVTLKDKSPKKLTLLKLNNDWQDKFIHGNNFKKLNPQPIKNTNPKKINNKIIFDVKNIIKGNGTYSFALKSSSSENLKIAGLLKNSSDIASLDIRFKTPRKSFLQATIDDYKSGTLRMGISKKNNSGYMAAIKFDLKNLEAGTIQKALLRVNVPNSISEVNLFRLPNTDWEETPGHARAITAEKLKDWLPVDKQVPLATVQNIKEGNWITFDLTGHITKEEPYAFGLVSFDKSAAIFSREAQESYEIHPDKGRGPELILKIKPPENQPPVFKKNVIQLNTAKKGKAYKGSLTWQVNNPDNQKLFFSLITPAVEVDSLLLKKGTSLPETHWLKVNRDTGELSGTPGGKDEGEQYFWVRVQGEDGGNSIVLLVIKVLR